MTDSGRYRDMTDDQLENLIRGLPRREPAPVLRDRIVSHAAPRLPGRRAVFRPAFALAALGMFLIADLLVLKVQDAGLAASAKPFALTVTAQAPAAEDEDVAWLREMGASSLSLEIALRSAQEQKQQQTYPSLLKALLEGAEGG